MLSLRNLFKKYTGVLRGIKGLYVINNLLNYKKLRHNRNLYKKYGLHRSVFSPIGSHLFKNKSNDIPWLDKENAKEALENHPKFKNFDPQIQEQLRQFERDGFMILKKFFTEEEVERSNKEIDRILSEDKMDFNYTGRKLMEAYKYSDYINQTFFRNPKLLEILDFIMGKKIFPFHTIHFIEGSEQRAHSDSIHMTTEPQGYLTAAWIALEPTDENNGPLFYYPGSHRLPYILCPDYDSGNTKYALGDDTNSNYEDRIEQMIQEKSLKKKNFYAEAGDVLVWHANLLHGGNAIKEAGRTRKSMVSHYFCEDVICYHEMSQRPALLEH